MRIYVGFDERELDAYMVCIRSLARRARGALQIYTLTDRHCRFHGLYWRAYRRETSGQEWDLGDGRPFSTAFSFARFLVPHLARADNYKGPALFCDQDWLWRAPIDDLFALADERYAVQVVKHDHRPEGRYKMRGQVQTRYERKNWSSLVLWNCGHLAHLDLSLEAVNAWPGSDLHGFRWLKDEQIGDLPEAWNWIEGHSSAAIEPHAVHYSDGTPDMPGKADVPYAHEWRAELAGT